MKILTAEDIKGADLATIESQQVSSLELMERAAEAISQVICNIVEQDGLLLFLVGRGNNGGDGLAAARILANAGFNCAVKMAMGIDGLSEEAGFNYQRLPESVKVLDGMDIPFDTDTVVIDSILGSGVRGEIKEPLRNIFRSVNNSGCKVISIDLPSGMKTGFGNNPDQIIHADYTITIQFPKLAMLLPDAGECCGEIIVVDIELDSKYIESSRSGFYYTDRDVVREILLPRLKFGHKGTYGHALMVCGSEGMAGAAILATGGALRSGCGMVTCHVPGMASGPLHANMPSAILSLDKSAYFSQLPPDLDKYGSIGVGCGLGQEETTVNALRQLLEQYGKSMVIDADALNIISKVPELRQFIPPGSVLTPHPGEFERLAGKWRDEEDKIFKLRELSRELNSTVILKGAYTMVCLPSGDIHINSTGSPGMAKAGNGDVLTGFITGLIARAYKPEKAAILGVYIHGSAGEKAAGYYGEESSNSADLLDFLAEAYLELK